MAGEFAFRDALKDFQRDLRSLDRDLPKQLRVANLLVAKMVAERAQSKAQSLGGVAAHVAPSIKARAEQRSASITLGGPRYPMAMGANFGAWHDRPRNRPRGTVLGWNQFPTPLGAHDDRFMFATVRAEDRHIVDLYEKALEPLLRQAFPRQGV